jgi:hypothetical protein
VTAEGLAKPGDLVMQALVLVEDAYEFRHQVVPSACGSPRLVAAVLRALGKEPADRCFGPVPMVEQFDDLLADFVRIGPELGCR